MEPGGSSRHSQKRATSPILSQISDVHTSLSHFLKINFNVSIHLRQGLPSGSFS
jgi:hypothetical protein